MEVNIKHLRSLIEPTNINSINDYNITYNQIFNVLIAKEIFMSTTKKMQIGARLERNMFCVKFKSTYNY